MIELRTIKSVDVEEAIWYFIRNELCNIGCNWFKGTKTFKFDMMVDNLRYDVEVITSVDYDECGVDDPNGECGTWQYWYVIESVQIKKVYSW